MYGENIAKEYTDVRGLTEGTATGIFLVTALQLIAGMFQEKLSLEYLPAQFLLSLKRIAIIWCETKQGSKVVIRYFAPDLPLLQEPITRVILFHVYDLALSENNSLSSLPASHYYCTISRHP